MNNDGNFQNQYSSHVASSERVSQASPPFPPQAYPQYPHHPPSPPKARRGGCLFIFIGFCIGSVLVGVVGLIIAIAVGMAESSNGLDGKAYGEDEFPSLTETWSAGRGKKKVVRVPLRGLITLGDGGGWTSGGDDSAAAAFMAIRRATKDADVAGLLLEVDSGGGGITASDIIFQAILEFKAARKGRSVVVLMGDTAASGAYYLSLAADRIVAHSTTVTGSIGVILPSYNVRELTDRLGIKDVSLTSGANKSILNPMGEIKPEQQAMLQEIVNKLHEKFVGLVATHRMLDPEEVRPLADGRIFLAEKALELGLVDQIGYQKDAMKEVERLLGEPAKFVRYTRRYSLRDMLTSPGFWGAALSQAVPRVADGAQFQMR